MSGFRRDIEVQRAKQVLSSSVLGFTKPETQTESSYDDGSGCRLQRFVFGCYGSGFERVECYDAKRKLQGHKTWEVSPRAADLGAIRIRKGFWAPPA